MKSLAILVAVASLFATSAHARIGETVKQVEARYGKPEKVFIDRPDLRKVGYGFRRFMIIVEFSGGISKRESFARPDLPKLPSAAVNEILALSVRPGTSWQPAPAVRGDSYWVSSDKKMIAQLAAPGSVVIVQDRTFKSSE